jgi:O-antigen/teichoic acid export membrane protein
VLPQSEKRPASFSSSLLTILGGQAVCAGLGVVMEICYARMLGASGRGEIGLCLMAIAAFAMLGGLGVETPALVWAADGKRRPAEWVAGVWLSGAVGSAIAAAVWAATFWRFHPAFLKGITDSMAWLILVSIPCLIFLGYLVAIIAGQERFALRAGVTLAEQVSGLVIFVGFVLLFGRHAELAIVANLASIVLSIGICVFVLRDLFQVRVSRIATALQMRAALGIGLPGIMGNLATFLNYRLDVFIVNYFLNPAAVGIYALGVVVSEALWQIPRAAALALFSRTARTYGDDTEFTCLVLRHVLLIATATGAAIAIASPFLIPLVFGAQFAPSVAVIWWILPGTICLSVAKIMCADLAGRKKPQFASLFAFFSLLLTIVLDLTLIPRFGINGAAIASSAAYIFNSALLALVLKRELGMPWKAMVLPTNADCALYWQLWSRYRSRLFQPKIAAAPNELKQNEVS